MSSYTSCPCCGYDTISDDEESPELCSDCVDASCADDGCAPYCRCTCCGGQDCTPSECLNSGAEVTS